MKKYIHSIIILIGLLGLGLQEGQAQSTLNLDSVVVSASRIPIKVSETGRNITVLRSEEIQKIPFTSIDELLQYIPGVEVQSRNAFGAQGDITIRGSTFTQVLVLINGMKLNDPLTSHFNSYLPISPSEIERIEVLRGAAAAIYGADAVGGVVHIITKGFGEDQQEKSDITGTFNYGENNLINTYQGIYIRKKKYFVSAGFNLNQSDGEEIPERTFNETTLEGYNNFFNIRTLGFSFGFDLPKGWAIKARTAFDDRDFSARFFYTSSPLDKSTEKTRHWWNQLLIQKESENRRTDLNMVYKYNTDEFVFSPDFPSTNNHTTRFFNLNFNHLQKISTGFEIQGGIQADRREIESNDRGNHQDWHFGVYAVGLIRPVNNLNLTASLRLDYDENYDLEFSPQLNISYLLPRLTLRASVGRSIRAADYTERYVSNNLENLTPGRNLGNPELLAEQSWSEEIGIDYQVTDNWLLKATGFFRQSDNLIDYVNTNESEINGVGDLQDGGDYFFARNVTEVRTNGFELESWFMPRFGDNMRLQMSLGYTYLNTTNDEDVISVYISSHARHLLTSNLIFSSAKFDLAINGILKVRDAQVAEAINTSLSTSYTLWNLRASYRMLDALALNLQIHNVFDEAYQDILGAPMPGRWIMGGFQYRF